MMQMDERKFRAITVYCASSNAVEERYMELAAEAGREIARRGMEMVYGGGAVGMMGRAADAALEAGGRVRGVITRHLETYEVSHPGITQLETVETMHERKLAMTVAGDAFFVLPGGFGTLDEAMEAITWKQLRIHTKPIVIVNTFGYFDTLLRFFDEAVERLFIHEDNLRLFEVAANIGEAFEKLATAEMPDQEPSPLWRAPRP
jgi:uncharacterized protein (TIGR00730 family)